MFSGEFRIFVSMARVFISYAKKDYIAGDGSVIPGNPVDSILSRFQREGIDYWLDREQLSGGDTYAARIARNIKACDYFLFLSTEAANASPWTLREISAAIQLASASSRCAWTIRPMTKP